jgi:hypothetical protein
LEVDYISTVYPQRKRKRMMGKGSGKERILI